MVASNTPRQLTDETGISWDRVMKALHCCMQQCQQAGFKDPELRKTPAQIAGTEKRRQVPKVSSKGAGGLSQSESGNVKSC